MGKGKRGRHCEAWVRVSSSALAVSRVSVSTSTVLSALVGGLQGMVLGPRVSMYHAPDVECSKHEPTLTKARCLSGWKGLDSLSLLLPLCNNRVKKGKREGLTVLPYVECSRRNQPWQRQITLFSGITTVVAQQPSSLSLLALLSSSPLLPLSLSLLAALAAVPQIGS